MSDTNSKNNTLKVGILTLYYSNNNFGSSLQAYALPTFINQFENVCAKQICYDFMNEPEEINYAKIFTENTPVEFTQKTYKLILKKLDLAVSKELKVEFDKRRKKFKKFEQAIPHTDEVIFDKQNENIINNSFDIFVVGSDQVWNPSLDKPNFYFNFVDDDKRKIAYATSGIKSVFTDDYKNKYIPLIKRFDYISFREKSSVEIMSEFVDKNYYTVLDPVFLLNRKQWVSMVNNPLVNEKYAFTYVLSENKKSLASCKNIANSLNLPIANIPYLEFEDIKHLKNYSKYTFSDVSPKDFLSLIYNCEIVLTNSFHAIAFCIIFEKRFIAFNRDGNYAINSRITDLLSDVNMSKRFVLDLNNFDTSLLHDKLDFTYAKKVLSRKIKSSIEFLKESFKDTILEKQLNEYIKNNFD